MVRITAHGLHNPAQKPPPGMWLSTGLPICSGLTNAILCQEGGGITLANLPNPVQPFTVQNTQNWRRTALGPAFNTTQGASGAYARTVAGVGPVSLSGAQITLEAWCVADSFNTVAGDSFISSVIAMDMTADANMVDLRLGSDGTLAHNNIATFSLNLAGSPRACFGTAATAGVPQHLVGTYDGVIMRLYQQGVQTGTAANSGAVVAATQPLALGRNLFQGQGRGLIGAIILARTWNRALAAVEVQSLYLSPFAMLAPSRSLMATLATTAGTGGGTGGGAGAVLSVGRRPRGPGMVATW